MSRSDPPREISGSQIIIRNGNGTKLQSISIDSLMFSKTRTKTIYAERVKMITHLGNTRLPPLPVSSCNGLILIPHYSQERPWVLWNPFTGEFRKLPLYDSEGDRMPHCGLGYDSVADDYKVVRISELYDGERASETLVFSLKSNSWKRIVDFPGEVRHYGGEVGNGVFTNGAIHWTRYNNSQEEIQIVVLDLENENYRIMSLPSEIRAPDLRLGAELSLNVLGGCLFVTCCRPSCRVEGWIMNEYGVEESWTKLFSFKKLYAGSDMGEFKPIAYLKSKGLVLMQYDGEKFVWYDILEKTAKEFEIGGVSGYFSSQVFPVSLVQLFTDDDDSDIEGGVVSSGTAKRKRDDRLKLKVTFEDLSIKVTD